MHPVMVLVAFAIATLVTYAVVLAVLSATSPLLHEDRDDSPHDRDDLGESQAPVPAPVAGTALPPWVPVPVGGDRTLQRVAPAATPAPAPTTGGRMSTADRSPAPARSTRPGRPRAASVDQKLHETVLQLLREGGPSAVTIDGVTARSGVAKTTIYRRHANRSDLLTSVLASAVSAPEVPRDGTVRDKIRIALEQVWHQMDAVLGPGGLAALVANSDPEFTDLFRAALRPYIDMLVSRMREDIDAGLLRPDLDADGVVSLMLGAYLGELVRHGEVEPGWVDRTIDLLWMLMTPST